MVLYHLGHYGLLSKCITHKIAFNNQREAIFLVDEKLSSPSTRKYLNEIKDKFEEARIAKIITYSDDIFVDLETEQELKQTVISFFDKNLDGYNIEEIYTGFDTFDAFGIYLTLKKKPYYLIELSTGYLEIRRYNLNNKKVYDGIIEKYNTLCSDNELVLGVIRNKDGREKITDKDIFVDYRSIEQSFDATMVSTILYCFGMSELEKQSGKFNLLVMSSYWTIFYLKKDFDWYFNTYHRILDLYAINDCKVILKPHPNSDFVESRWDNLHNGTLLISGGFPSGYMHLLKNLNIIQVIGTGSTGLKEIFPKSDITNLPLIDTFKYADKLIDIYLAANISTKISTEKTQFHFFNFGKELLDYTFSSVWQKSIKFRGVNKRIYKGNIFVYVDFMSENDALEILEGLKNADEESVIFFSNRGRVHISKYLRDNKEMIKYMVPLDVVVESVNNDIDKTTKILFCKSQKIRQEMYTFIFTKSLYYSGQILISRPQKWYENYELKAAFYDM